MEDLTEKELEKLLRKKREEKKKIKFSKLVILLVILLNTLFTIGVLYVFLRVGNEPQVLIGAFFAFTTGELWMLSKIKREEIKEEDY